MTAVIGFYFGQAGVRRAEKRARVAEAEAASAVASMPEVAQAIDDVDEKAEVLDKLLEKVEGDPALRQKVDELLRDVREGRT